MAARYSGWILIGWLCLSPLAARADATVPSTAQAEQDEQLSFQLTESLIAEGDRAFVWRVSWTAINGALTAASIAGLFVLPRSQRTSLIVGAAASAVSTACTWFLPLDVEDDAETAASLPASPSAARSRRLHELYAHAARNENDRVQWPWHLVNLAGALVPATILWAGYGLIPEGFIQFGTGVILGELALLTQPTRLADRPKPQIAVRVGVTQHGAMILGTIVHR